MEHKSPKFTTRSERARQLASPEQLRALEDLKRRCQQEAKARGKCN